MTTTKEKRYAMSELITTAEAAELQKVGVSTFSRWVADGRAPQPVFSRSRFQLFVKAEVEKFTPIDFRLKENR